MTRLVNYTASSIRQLFFPHICAHCYAQLINRSQQLCYHCIADLPLTGFANHASNPIEKIFFGRTQVDAAMSMLYFTPASMVQQIIHQFKYKGQQKLAEYMGQLMGRQIKDSGRFPALDLVLPLPLSRSREQERGYNQAALLATGCARVLDLPMLPRLLVKTRNTATQTHMDREDRWNNVKGLFQAADPPLLENKSILLLDDVITTGATLEACTSALLGIRGCRVSIATLAYAAK